MEYCRHGDLSDLMKKKISLLKPHPHNKILYNDTDAEQVANLAENMEKYGQITPVVINQNNIILSGHRRIAALKVLGKTYAECTIKDIEPALIESSPRSGPTVRSSIMFKGAGSAPDLNNKARSLLIE